MTKDEIEQLLRAAVSDLETADGYLLVAGANERSLTHRLAVYIERRLPEKRWSVDCEFNRDGLDTKTLMFLADEYATDVTARELVQDTRGRSVFPDVIVHMRGGNGPNLLVLEAKRENASPREIERDRRKLRAYVQQYGYAHAYLVSLQRSASVIERVE